MTFSFRRPVLIALTAAALALGGCGRKSGLDLPPQAQAAPAPVVAPADIAEDRGPGSAADQALREEPLPPARSPKRKFILDPLLNSD